MIPIASENSAISPPGTPENNFLSCNIIKMESNALGSTYKANSIFMKNMYKMCTKPERLDFCSIKMDSDANSPIQYDKFQNFVLASIRDKRSIRASFHK